jgi:hypothetical protein
MDSFPYERFIRYLLSRKAEVNGALQRLKLPWLTNQDISERRENLFGGALPPIVDAYSRSNQVDVTGHPGFLAWIEKNHIADLWTRQPEFIRENPNLEAACKAFSNPAIRTVLGVLLLAKFESREICELIYTQYDLHFSEQALEYFRLNFWDTAFMTREDWVSFCGALEKDQRSLLSVAFAGKGRNYVKLHMGIVPEIELRDVLTDVLVRAHARFQELMEQPVADESLAMSWASLAIKAGEKRVRYGGGPARSFAEEAQMALDFDDPKLPTLADIGGSLPPTTTSKKAR